MRQLCYYVFIPPTNTPHTHTQPQICAQCVAEREGERARSSLHSFYVLKEPTDTPVQPDPNVQADVLLLLHSLRLALSATIPAAFVLQPAALLHSFAFLAPPCLSPSISPLSFVQLSFIIFG